MKTAVATTGHQSLEQAYEEAMLQYLKKPDESSLESAYELGRLAMEQGLGILEFTALHGEVMGRLLQNLPSPTAEYAAMVRTLNHFFIESLSPFEMTHRGYRDAQTALRRLNETLEAEAKRIAHALHDEAGQLLVTVHFALEKLAREVPPGFEPQVEEMRRRLREVEQQLRRLSHELRPPMLDDLGLVPALDFMAEGVSKRSGLHIVVQGWIPQRLQPLAEITLYRSVQEALNNVTKHAKAKSVTISLKQRRQDRMNAVVCSVKDDGIGLQPDATRGLGLLGIKERLHALGGSFDVNSHEGAGTELLFSIPFADSQAA